MNTRYSAKENNINTRLEKIEEEVVGIKKELGETGAKFQVGQEVWHVSLERFVTITRCYLEQDNSIGYGYDREGFVGYCAEPELRIRPRPKFKVGDKVYRPEFGDIVGTIIDIKWGSLIPEWVYGIDGIDEHFTRFYENSLELYKEPKRTPKAGEVWLRHDWNSIVLITGNEFICLNSYVSWNIGDTGTVDELCHTYLGTFQEVFHTFEEVEETLIASNLEMGLCKISVIDKTFLENLKNKNK